MRKTLATLAVAMLTLAGCSTGEDEATVSNTPAPTSTSATTSATSSSSSSVTPTSSNTEEQPTEEPVEQPMEQAAPVEQAPAADAVPTVVGCRNHGGTALMSDGSEAYSASCDENANGLVPGNTGNAYGPIDPGPQEVQPTFTGSPEEQWNQCVAEQGLEFCQGFGA